MARVFGVFQDCVDILIGGFGRQIFFNCQTWRVILAQPMLRTMILLDGCSLILLYLSLDSTNLLLNEIDLFAHNSASCTIATLLFFRVLITLITVIHWMIILVLILR